MDRDGTLSEEVGYMYHAGLYKPFPWTGPAIRLINGSELKAIVVTNQSGIGRGYFTEKTVDEVHAALNQELARWNAHLDGIYYCPHAPVDACDCRKPKPGMLLRAAHEMEIDLKASYMIGDRYLDIQMAHAVGARGVLVLTGDGQMEAQNRKDEPIQPHYVAANLLIAVQAILGGDAG
jgi:D-glycero-D-manno-heptose 1,7-bisphosphate phosphatase